MILLTRPADEAKLTADLLQARGYKTFTDPMLLIEAIPNNEPIGHPQAVLFTSANGVRCAPIDLLEHCDQVFTVGDATAHEARSRGFKDVRNAQGNADDLLALCISRLDPAQGPLIHYVGDVSRGNLVERLKNKGFQAEERIVYKSNAVDNLNPETQVFLTNGKITSALFFSPRTAKVFMQNLERHGLQDCLSKVAAYCLSASVAEELKQGSWAEVRIAQKPDQDSLLELIHPEGYHDGT